MVDNLQVEKFDEFLGIMNRLDILADVMIVGSWAEYVYKNSNILDFDVSMKTQDIDVLICNLGKPVPKIDLKKYIPQDSMIEQDHDGLMKMNLAGVLEIEFLVRELGVGQLTPYSTNLGVTAQGLRHMDILTRHSVSALYKNMIVQVPTPEAYVVHKLVINSNRLEYKREKDLFACQNIIRSLIRTDLQNCTENILAILHELTKKEWNALQKTIGAFPVITRDIQSILSHSDLLCVSQVPELSAFDMQFLARYNQLYGPEFEKNLTITQEMLLQNPKKGKSIAKAIMKVSQTSYSFSEALKFVKQVERSKKFIAMQIKKNSLGK